MIETVLDEEERGTRRKEGRGGRRNDEESKKIQTLLGHTKNNKNRGHKYIVTKKFFH